MPGTGRGRQELADETVDRREVEAHSPVGGELRLGRGGTAVSRRDRRAPPERGQHGGARAIEEDRRGADPAVAHPRRVEGCCRSDHGREDGHDLPRSQLLPPLEVPRQGHRVEEGENQGGATGPVEGDVLETQQVGGGRLAERGDLPRDVVVGDLRAIPLHGDRGTVEAHGRVSQEDLGAGPGTQRPHEPVPPDDVHGQRLAGPHPRRGGRAGSGRPAGHPFMGRSGVDGQTSNGARGRILDTWHAAKSPRLRKLPRNPAV